ncbi:hypothetical protein [Streptomyces sp. NPDC090036]|uniref:hypothetical protein n=1 Tax=Streptomyces sp. NPDC090036 TaxID=3365926 RepID=UPI00380C8D01
MTPPHTSCRRACGGPGRPRALSALTAFATLTALVGACSNETAPDWGYPELGTILGSLSRDLEEGCGATTAAASCAERLDRLTAPTERAFAEVLDHRLLDVATVAAMNDLDRAREVRVGAAEEARSRQEPDHLPLRRAVEAERLAYQRLLSELQRLRTAPPPGDGTDPV